MRVILYAKYEKEDLYKVMETQCQHLIGTQRTDLIKLLHIFEELFNETLGTWEKHPVEFDSKVDTKPICLLPYPVPKEHEEMFKKEVAHLVLLGVHKVANDSEWKAPSFVQPKPKSNRVRFLSNFRNLN